MQKREGRSFAPPPSRPPQPEPGRTGRKRWMRSDVPRPAAPVQAPLPSPDVTVTDIDELEEDTLDVMGCLSVEARRDVLAGSLIGIGGGRL